MNILLVSPFSVIEWNNKYEEPRIPLSIAYLAAAVRKSGHKVFLADLRVEQQKRKLPMPQSFLHEEAVLLTRIMEEKIITQDIRVVGLNCLYSGLFPVVRHLAKRIKSINPEIQVVIGGIHPTIYAKEILSQHYDCIDYVIIGEGEESLVALLQRLESKQFSELSSVDGLGYWDGKEVIIHPRRNYIENLDDLPFPAVDLLNIQDYFIDTCEWYSPKGFPIKTPVPIITSRSCPNMCNFCSMHLVHGKRIRYRSPENVVEEMKMYIQRYGLRYFNITDDNLTMNKTRLIKLMDLIIKEKLDIQFSTENGVYINGLDEEVLDALSAAGLVRLHLAFETGSDYIRNQVIKKHVSNKKIAELKDVLLQDKYNHIYLYGYFVIGFPEETKETLDETYQLITSFPLDNYSVFYAVPFPGTRLYEQCLKERLFTEEYFYDTKALMDQVDVGQMVKGLPSIKPYHLEVADLITFKQRSLDYLKEKRSHSSLPASSPLRYVGVKK